MGMLAAHAHGLQTGRGQRIDTALFEAGIVQTSWRSAIALATGVAPGSMGSGTTGRSRSDRDRGLTAGRQGGRPATAGPGHLLSRRTAAILVSQRGAIGLLWSGAV